MKKHRKRLAIMPIFIAFFSGVILTLFLLVPGKTGPTILVSGDHQVQVEGLNQAADRVEAVGDKLFHFAFNAKEKIMMGFDEGG